MLISIGVNVLARLLVRSLGRERAIGLGCHVSVLVADPILTRRAEIHRIAQETDHRREVFSPPAMIGCRLCLAVGNPSRCSASSRMSSLRGIGAWNIAFFTHLPTPAGIPGGGICQCDRGRGTLSMESRAAFAIPFGIAAGLFLAVSNGRVAGALRFSADVMSGIPSIVVGIFAYLVLARTLGHFSAIAASFALGLLMLPIMMRAGETAIRSVPLELSEAGVALGERQASVAWRVQLPAALPGLLHRRNPCLRSRRGDRPVALHGRRESVRRRPNPARPMADAPPRDLPEWHPGIPGPCADRLGHGSVLIGRRARAPSREQAVGGTYEESFDMTDPTGNTPDA